jgi:hypothetical protein
LLLLLLLLSGCWLLLVRCDLFFLLFRFLFRFLLFLRLYFLLFSITETGPFFIIFIRRLISGLGFLEYRFRWFV